MAHHNDLKGQSLFIVDRDWLRQDRNPRKSWTGNVRNRSLYGLAIDVTPHNTTNQGSATRRKSQAKCRRSSHQKDVSGNEHQSEHEPHLQNPPALQSHSAMIQWDRAQNSNKPSLLGLPGDAPTAEFSNLTTLSSAPTGFDKIKGLEGYLNYYVDVIGTSLHPVESKFITQNNPIRSSWFPLAFEDELWLQNITIFSALHHASNRNEPAPQEANMLMSTFLSELNDRIRNSDLSDGTIATVSCLALGEHDKGNNELSKIHIAGLAELVRLRGGLETIQHVRRAKIFRADIIRSVDSMEPPLLPRLAKDCAPVLPVASTLPHGLTSFLSIMSSTGRSGKLVTALWTIGCVSRTLDLAWTGLTAFDSISYYENILCVNHDLLSFRCELPQDEALRISLLSYTQPMYRQNAFSEHSCRHRSSILRTCLQINHHTNTDTHHDLAFWINFIGFMTAQNSADSSWFKAQLQQALDEHNVPRKGGWDQVKLRLQNFLWTECVHGSLGKQLYDTLSTNETTSRHS